jgi:serine/threonine-protein kinase PknG
VPLPEPVTTRGGAAEWRVRIQVDGVVRGAGMLVGEKQVLTCAHVVGEASKSDAPDGMVVVEFVSVRGTPLVRAKVAEGGWIPVHNDESGDLALLDLLDPDEKSPREYAPMQRGDFRGRRVQAFGFPEGAEQIGVNADATVSDWAGPGGEWIQLNSQPDDTRVTNGFSGAAVVDEETGAVIGMVVMAYARDRPSVSWMTPVETILHYLRDLSDCVAGSPAVDGELAAVDNVSPAQGGVAQKWGGFFRRIGPPVRLVVTGEPGSSVTAGLRSMIVLADRERRPRSSGPPGDRTVPPIGSVDLAVNASGKTVEELSARINDRFEPSTDSRRRLPATLVVDGVDDADDPEALLRKLLKPLADDGIRLLLGFRRESSQAWQLARSLWPGGDKPDDHPDVVRDRLDELGDRIAYLAKLEAELRRYRASVAEQIADVPDLKERAFALRAWLTALRGAPIDTAGLNEAEEAAARTGLRLEEFRRRLDAVVDRRDELLRLLAAYHKVAVNRGLAEDIHLDGYYRRAEDALWRAPCDLAVAARLVGDYREAIRAVDGGSMDFCTRPGCPGVILETGYCDICANRPGRTSEESSPLRPEPNTPTKPAVDTWIAGDLVSLPNLTLDDPTRLVLPDTSALPEDYRYCGECREEVGRSYRGQDDLADGFCEHCGARYSYSLKLFPNDEVDEKRYLISGPLARGGLGLVYLAWDRRLGQWVVLKGLINTEDRRARQRAVDERIALTSLEHPKVVRIHDLVSHPDPASGEPIDYIVMEYVGGPTLEDLRGWSGWLVEHGRLTPRQWLNEHGALTAEHVIAYVLEILDALKYLHDVGLLYCDMKPANAIRGADRLKVIDLGAVRAIGDGSSASVETEGYRVSDGEIARHGRTVRSDLHTVGVTLKKLYEVTDRDESGPDRSLGLRSLRHIYERATDTFHRRFGSAAEMSEQLMGVLREIVALRDGKRHPEPSTVFDEPTVLLDAGLGGVPSLTRWTDVPSNADEPLADGRPSPHAVALGLPVPLVRADDQGAGYLARLLAMRSVTDARALVALLEKPSTPRSVEVRMLACRAMIELKKLDGAKSQLAAASGLLGHPESADWRFAWHRGLIELAEGKVAAARPRFAEVYRDVPGEDAPKLALGFCAEHCGDLSEAEMFYEAVWERERLQASAAFGLARVRLASKGRLAAVAVLDEVGDNSRHFEAAQIAAIMVLSGRLAPGAVGEVLPTAADLNSAVERLLRLESLDGGERAGPLRARLTTVLREAALELARKGALAGVRGGHVLGDPPDKRKLCTLLEGSYRRLADQAGDAQDHGVLVDRANAVRPNTWW